jgi:hypothetical protein
MSSLDGPGRVHSSRQGRRSQTAPVLSGHLPVLDPSPVTASPSDAARDRLRSLPRAVLRDRPKMGVGVEGRGRLGLAERALDGHDVATGRDEAGGVEVPQVVELDAR